MSNAALDAIVIGLGGMGSATAHELARRGRSVLGLEQFTPVHDLGSSHGQTRIIRKAYYEHPAYVPLVQSAYAGWYALEQRVGKKLLTECPCLTIGPPEKDLLAGVRRAAEAHRLSIEQLTAEELRQRFPVFRPAPGDAALLEHGAGFLAVEKCVDAFQQEARLLGADLRFEEPVLSWSASDQEVTVKTTRGEYRAASLVLTAGPWATGLLADLTNSLTLMRQIGLWFGTSQPQHFGRDAFPVFIADTPDGYFYGLPMIDSLGVKVSRHYGAPVVHRPEEIVRAVSPDDHQPVRAFLDAYLPEIDGPVQHSSVCIYTLTPDRHFLIDVHPAHANVCFAAGFSGHGFKFAPAVGEVLADLVEQGSTSHPVEMFRLRG